MYRRSLVEKFGGFRDDLPVIQDARFEAVELQRSLGMQLALHPRIAGR